MNVSDFILRCVVGTLLGIGSTAQAYAEISCAPAGSPVTFAVENDPSFPQALAIWMKVSGSRYVEGDNPGSCHLFPLAGYAGFPTERCSYANADEGSAGAGANPTYPPIAAQVVLLDPSAKQLAMWSVNACKINMATGVKMTSCLKRLSGAIVSSNSATFPIVGSVVESICNSTAGVPACGAPADKNRAPRNTLIRDGVSVGYSAASPWQWRPGNFSAEIYDELFDTSKSDGDIVARYNVSRISSAVRHDWQVWRSHIGKPLAPDGINPQGFSLDGAGWLTVSREVQKAACQSDSNDLMNAVVYARHYAN